MGENCKAVIKWCKIKFNLKSGLFLGTGVKAFCIRNDIAHNYHGIKTISCSSKIMNNSIRNSKRHGIIT